MNTDLKIAFIGAGHLAESIIHALVDKLGVNGQNITIFDINEEQYKKYVKLNVRTAHKYYEILDSGDIIFLMVLPQNFAVCLPEIKNCNMVLTKKIFVSTAAGITTEYIESEIGQKVAVIRTMPNTPISLGKGMTALCHNSNTSDKSFKTICDIFAALGENIILPEDKMNAIISVNGSSPAYVYLFAEAMLKGAIAQGFTEDEIYPAVLQSLIGSFEMLKNSGKSPGELIKSVAVPGGTTEKALDSFYSDNFAETVKKAMLACTKRADELTKEYCGD
ncbi:MAG: pyrroline-5-carboxylate reductase [Oscillospiraceae bacterium]|nr:pyrroline-5-carboxylate reductase [Oscillospiraceae bacterium]